MILGFIEMLEKVGILVFGVFKEVVKLEVFKSYMKVFVKECGIKSVFYFEINDLKEVLSYI